MTDDRLIDPGDDSLATRILLGRRPLPPPRPGTPRGSWRPSPNEREHIRKVDGGVGVDLESGRVVESGTHDELVAERGLYAALWRIQTGEVHALPQVESA